MFDVAIVVGKFCPLHLGHMHLLDAADKESLRLVIITYTSKAKEYGYPDYVRKAWLQALYPAAVIVTADHHCPADDAPDRVHRAFCENLCRTIGYLPDAVFSSEEYGDGFAKFLEARFEKPVFHRCVDLKRETVPISGTMIRQGAPISKFLHPIVARGIPKRIAFVGAESTGKTTLAQAVAEQTNSVYVPEYGRLYGELTNQQYSFESMRMIARKQIELEEIGIQKAILLNKRFVICDTTPLTTAIYSHLWFNEIIGPLCEMMRRRYDKTFLCAADFDYVDDGTRNGINFRALQQTMYFAALADRVYLEGCLDRRIQTVLGELREYN